MNNSILPDNKNQHYYNNENVILASQIIGYIAGIFVIFINIPQIYLMFKNKSGKNVSLTMVILNIISGLLFLSYGILIFQLPLILGNIAYNLVSLTMLFSKIYFKLKNNNNSNK